MRILFLGDVMGRSGRSAITQRLAGLKSEWRVDFTIVNAENATSGAGLSGSHAKALLDGGADCLTLGDHAFDQKDMLQAIEGEPRILAPPQLRQIRAGQGRAPLWTWKGRKILVAQALGQVFMKRPFEDPFSALDHTLRTLGGQASARIVDFHAEATSEKMAMGHYLDGRASLVVGTHTHVPTGDAMILPGGTGYMTDAGMCGDYNTVIGMDKAEPLRRFITGMPKERFAPGTGEATLSGVFIETDDKTGKATSITPIREGGRLQRSVP